MITKVQNLFYTILKATDIKTFLTLTDDTASYAGTAKLAAEQFGAGIYRV